MKTFQAHPRHQIIGTILFCCIMAMVWYRTIFSMMQSKIESTQKMINRLNTECATAHTQHTNNKMVRQTHDTLQTSWKKIQQASSAQQTLSDILKLMEQCGLQTPACTTHGNKEKKWYNAQKINITGKGSLAVIKNFLFALQEMHYATCSSWNIAALNDDLYEFKGEVRFVAPKNVT